MRTLYYMIAACILLILCTLPSYGKDTPRTPEKEIDGFTIGEYIEFLSYPDEDSKVHALGRLKKFGDEADVALDAIMKQIDTDNERVLSSIGRALVEIGTPLARKSLARAVSEYPKRASARLLSECVKLEGDLGEELRATLLGALRHEDDNIRDAAARLIALHALEFKQHLTEIGSHIPDSHGNCELYLRAAIIVITGKGDVYGGNLKGAPHCDSSFSGSARAAEALCIAAPYMDNPIDALIPCLGHSFGTKRNPLDTLIEFGEAALPKLFDRIKDANLRDISCILEAIAEIDPGAVGKVIETCDGVPDLNRPGYIRGLGNFDSRIDDIAPILIEAIESGDHDERSAAADTMARVIRATGTRVFVPALSKAIPAYPEGRNARYFLQRVCHALAAHEEKFPELVPEIIKVARSENSGLAYEALRSLLTVCGETPEVVDYFVECLDSEEINTRRLAVYRIAKIAKPATRLEELLLEILDDEDKSVSYTAAKALADVAPANKRTFLKLKAFLAERDRKDILIPAIGKTAAVNPEALEYIKAIAEGNDCVSKIYAIRILKELGCYPK